MTERSNQEALATLFRIHGTMVLFSKYQQLTAQMYRKLIFLIDDGFVSSWPAGSQSSTRRRYIYMKGELLNLEALSQHSRTDTVYETLSDVKLFKLEKDELLAAVAQQQTLSAALLEQVLEQNRYYRMRVENLSYIYASDKLIYRLLYLAERFGHFHGRTIVIPLSMSHRQIGSFINLTRETVSREMEKLIKKKLIAYDKEVITITRPPALIRALHQTVRTDWSGVLMKHER